MKKVKSFSVDEFLLLKLEKRAQLEGRSVSNMLSIILEQELKEVELDDKINDYEF